MFNFRWIRRSKILRITQNHPRGVVEAALAHVVGNQTEAAYARSDLFERRRRLMDEWAAYLAGERGQVIAMRR